MNWRYRYNKTLCLLTRPPRAVAAISGAAAGRNQRRLIRAAMTDSVADTVSSKGNIPSLFLLVLGASPVHIGLLATLNQSFQLSKIVGLQLLPRLGKARLCAWGRLVSTLPLLLLAFASVRPGPAPGSMVVPALMMFALRGLISTGGNTGWQPLVQDSIPADGIGAFYARLRVRLRLVDFAVPMALGAFLGASPAAWRFLPLFLLGVAVKLAGCYFFSGTVERPVSRSRKPLFSRIRRVLGKGSVRRYGWFSAARLFVFTAYHPLWVVVLRDHGLPASQLVWLGTAAALGNVIGIGRWGRASDARGSRWVVTVTLLPQAALGFMWLLMPAGGEGLFPRALFLYLFHGFLNGGLGLAKTRAMIQSVPASLQAEGFVVAGYLQAAGGAAGGIFGGLAVQWLGRMAWPASVIDPRHLYLALMQFALVGVWFLSRSIRDSRTAS